METVVEKFKASAEKECGNHIKRMVLFGSVARGKKTKDSDFDILVVWKGNRRAGWEKLEKIAFHLLLETEEYISLKVITPDEFRKMETIGTPFIKNITKEGIVLV